MDDWRRRVSQRRCVPVRQHYGLIQPLSDYLNVVHALCSTLPGEVVRRPDRGAPNLSRRVRLGVPSAVVGDAGHHDGLLPVHRRQHRARRQVRPSIRLAQATEGFAS